MIPLSEVNVRYILRTFKSDSRPDPELEARTVTELLENPVHFEYFYSLVEHLWRAMSTVDFRQYSARELYEIGLTRVYKIFIKNEPHPSRKVAIDKLRLIIPSSAVLKVVECMLIRRFDKWSIDHWDFTPDGRVNPFKPGMGFTDEHASSVTRGIEQVMPPGVTCLSVDIQSWDWSVTETDLMAEMYFRYLTVDKTSYTPEQKSTLLLRYSNLAVLCSRKVYATSDGRAFTTEQTGIQPSGRMGTSSGNCIIAVLRSVSCGAQDVISMGDDCLAFVPTGSEAAFEKRMRQIAPLRVCERYFTARAVEFCSHHWTAGKASPIPSSVAKMVVKFLSDTHCPHLRASQLAYELRHFPDGQALADLSLSVLLTEQHSYGRARKTLNMEKKRRINRRLNQVEREVKQVHTRPGPATKPEVYRNLNGHVNEVIRPDRPHYRGMRKHIKAAGPRAQKIRESARLECNRICRQALSTVRDPFNPNLDRAILTSGDDGNVVSCNIKSLTRVIEMETNGGGFGFVVVSSEQGPYSDRNGICYSDVGYVGDTTPTPGAVYPLGVYGRAWYNSPYTAAAVGTELEYACFCVGLRVTPISNITVQEGIVVGWRGVGDEADTWGNHTYADIAMMPSASSSSAVNTATNVVWMADNTKFRLETDANTTNCPSSADAMVMINGASNMKYHVEVVAIYYLRGAKVGDLLTRALHSTSIFQCLSQMYSSEHFLKITFRPCSEDADTELTEETVTFWDKIGPVLSQVVEVGLPILMQQFAQF